MVAADIVDVVFVAHRAAEKDNSGNRRREAMETRYLLVIDVLCSV